MVYYCCCIQPIAFSELRSELVVYIWIFGCYYTCIDIWLPHLARDVEEEIEV
jgi:hypothetical protein